LAGALFIELSIAILGTGLKAISSEGPTIPAGFGSPAQIGELLLERFLVAFEAASILLLIAAVGAVVLAARRKQEPPIVVDRAGASPDTPGREAEEVSGVVS
jgi:NADH:ubiquinone oxidoreductase subunit 6 (subunit J)